MGFWSSVGSFVSRSVSTVTSVVKNTYESAKQVVGKAVEFLATKAESLVETVKDTWVRMKPYVEKFRTYVKLASDYVPIPWMKAALMAVDKGIEALFAFEKSPIAQKIEAAIQWAIKIAKRLQNKREEEDEIEQEESVINESELRTAKEHQTNIRSADEKLRDSGLSHEIALLTTVNDFEIAKTDIAKAIKDGVKNFEHYLRLRATQKLLRMADKTFRHATDIHQISDDDIFLVRVASDLIKADPELSDSAAIRLDNILQDRYNKKLTPFVFEEMIASWASSAEAEEQRWNSINKILIKDKMLERNLSVSKSIQGELSTDEESTLKQLHIDIPAKQSELDQIQTKKLDIDRYVGASEGFLQLLEKEHEEIINDGNDFLIIDSPVIGELLMRCAEQNIPFNELNKEDQDLIRDYSNIFKKDSRTRMSTILTVTA